MERAIANCIWLLSFDAQMRQQSEKTRRKQSKRGSKTQKHLPSKIKDEEEAVEIFVLDLHNDTLWSLEGILGRAYRFCEELK